ncbi:MAG: hypothetical protein H8E14_14335 [Candidatus Marinimicrobia bacterium]|nr:hypothetical protein [Candidatus Neomarinimicrobiota bacterium]
MKQSAPIIILILIFAAIWWFWGREPYITMEHPSDPILIYYEPKWNGWDNRGLKWVSDIPQVMKDDFPEAEGWWHVVHRTIPAMNLPPIDMENLDMTMIEWEKYYIWIPLHYRLPNNRLERDEE